MTFAPLTRRLASRLAPLTFSSPFKMQSQPLSTATVNAQLASLKGQNFMSTAQLNTEQLTGLIAKAQEFKATYSDPETKATAPKPLTGEICSMIFQKRSTRTRISSEVGMHLLGGKGLFLSSDDIQLGVNETMKDTALVLSRFNSIILARVYGHKDILELGELATVPVINALSDKFHPLQMLADYMTVKEHFGKFEGLTFSWVGDGNNVLHDYMLAAPKLGANIQIATPEGYEPDQDVVEETKRLAALAGTKVVMTTDPVEAVKGANVVATDTWISMGQEEESQKRLKAFAGYQVTNKMLENAAGDHIFLHCLPRHQDEVNDEVRNCKVEMYLAIDSLIFLFCFTTLQVFYGDRSLVFDEAENRLWTVMAVYASLLGKF
ncbi:Ornithine carbamoyltransferase [Phytophthora citrophthora]|uniref:ornithine carbamoyltransferase n=1 Tax=Phytophthora citrophthora TaxID=4793 RepID=A0AAD9G578_9STRA|nr:Ornithine carbamoyltransferase [Phytophthora citrophthora]